MSSPYQPELLALPSLTPALALEVLPKGLTLHRLYVQADGRTHDILVGPENPAEHALFPYTNTIIGRYTNRIPVGTYNLSHSPLPGAAATSLQSTADIIPNSATSSQKASLHGGPEGFDARVWEQVDVESGAAAPTLFSAQEVSTLRVPGELLVEAIVGLIDVPPSASPKSPTVTPVNPDAEYKLGSVLLVYRAKLQGEAAVTPINLTQHWGFNLDASLHARRPRGSSPAPPYGSSVDLVEEHKLTLKADATAAIDGDQLPTGKFAPVSEDPGRDFRNGKKIGEGKPAKGFDEFWAFENPVGLAEGKQKFAASELPGANLLAGIVGETMPNVPEATLEGGKSGLKVEFWTNQAGVQFYSAEGYDRSNSRKRIHGGTGVKGTGDGYGRGAAAFLEFHEPLSAFLHPGLVRNGNDSLLGPDEVYNNWVRADVSYRSVPDPDPST